MAGEKWERDFRAVLVEAVGRVDLFADREMPAGAPVQAGLDLELVSVPVRTSPTP
jgi:hypothetical protein